MRLWTWQNKEIDIRDGSRKLDPEKHSPYLQKDSPYYDAAFHRAYQDLWKMLGTKQFHWYYTSEEEAKATNEINQNNSLWTLELPENDIYRRVCSYAWEAIRGNHNCIPPTWLEEHRQWIRKTIGISLSVSDMRKQFSSAWSRLNNEELRDSLFVGYIKAGCTQVLLRHPIPKEWVVGNPIHYEKLYKSTFKELSARL